MTITEIDTINGMGYKIIQMVKNKPHKFIVDSSKKFTEGELKWDGVYQYRAIIKCKAGFMTISESTEKLRTFVTGWAKGALHTVEIYRPDVGFWSKILIMKSGKFHRVNQTIIENLTVGDIHSNFPTMADHNHWKMIGSKTWADKAYGSLKENAITSQNISGFGCY